ncbi:retrotransposable element tf2 protein type 2 [Lasius niger]|uniref:Retrotransposable element tf2 protein type 2 n=1 Tax=Lasius niger TaxID=67767 RepID=A0A0J7KF17_LASNI|nr:retrotransposable element tf2 protein type 2 [Lasius niger]
MQTMKKTDVCTRIARWALFLQDFQYTVEHRPGKSMRHVDALSRNALPMAMLITESQEGILARLQKNQADDEELSSIRDRAMNNLAEGFVIKNGLLHKELNGDTLIVIPRLMQNSIIRQTHERGHFGPDKTEKLLKMNY